MVPGCEGALYTIRVYITCVMIPVMIQDAVCGISSSGWSALADTLGDSCVQLVERQHMALGGGQFTKSERSDRVKEGIDAPTVPTVPT